MADIALLYAEQYKKIKRMNEEKQAATTADGESVFAGIARRAGQAFNRGIEKFAVRAAEGAVDHKGLFSFAILEGCFSS